MPMIDLTLPRGALSKEQLQALMHRAVKTLMWWEKIPDTPEARKIAWAFVNEVDANHVYVGGPSPALPRYRFRVQTIEGLMDDRAKQGVIRDLTKLVLEIEGVPHDLENASRVWCILREYPRQNWGIGGYAFPPSGYLSSSDAIKISEEDFVR
jgi:phenylpyruvate tautomerase PptA (4-oxalocrotonate tautomerase family)